MAKKFDPALDNSPGTTSKAGNLVLVLEENMCLCGCGDQPTSKGGRFLPGHDMKLRGKLTRAAEAGVKVEIRQNGKTTQTQEPKALATEHKWTLGSPTPPKKVAAVK